MHPSNKLTPENLDAVFTYQNDPSRGWRFPAVREPARELARAILELAPDCADRSAALRAVREAVAWANAAIALAPELPSADEHQIVGTKAVPLKDALAKFFAPMCVNGHPFEVFSFEIFDAARLGVGVGEHLSVEEVFVGYDSVPDTELLGVRARKLGDIREANVVRIVGEALAVFDYVASECSAGESNGPGDDWGMTCGFKARCVHGEGSTT